MSAPLTFAEALIVSEEGFRGLVYDDANGATVRPGTRLAGHPTVGYGIALDRDPLTEDEGLFLLRNRMASTVARLTNALPWFDDLTECRRAVITSMAYQMGVGGLLGFHDMLVACRDQEWVKAADAMADSTWAHQFPTRSARLAALMVAGVA